ncbi:LOW QUALITY PROTEIN: Reverse transcriptase [Phytophthora palmivora]|uniref:Reverse transcriptase n=1 Tax=Phytophthora palmivora TaxID=4796 RepID=A0A2P4Y6V0_9STRA|nr:LOW QUALITY PROTEIN: Reverse transcriptase [Phytophthora palmivora]
MPGFVSVGSRRYMKWQNLALEATVKGGSEHNEILMESTEPMVKPELTTEDQPSAGTDPQDRTPIQPVGTEVTNQNMDRVKADNLDPVIGGSAERDLPGQLPAPIQEASPENRNNSPDPEPDPEMHCHEGDDLYAEDVDQEMAILPEINPTTDEVKIEDIQGIWGSRPLQRSNDYVRGFENIDIFSSGNALPPAARGVVCDIDVGDARRGRKIAPRFREKLSELIKGLLSAKMISYSRSPWASPIMVIVKKNGVDIRLCIDYHLVNSLTQLMVYPMSLINDLLEDLDKVLWYCSLDMASGFRVVTMTDRSRAISAFITPFGLFEWNRITRAIRPMGVTAITVDIRDSRVKRGGGAYSAILWKLPEWTVVQARSAYAEDLTVNEAEYHGLLLCLDLLSTVDRKRVVFCGDSNPVIRQVRGEIECKAPGLTLLKQRALDRLKDWPDHELVHVKRDWNGSADSLASAALQRQGGVKIESDEDKQDLITLNRRVDRVRQAQDEEAWISGLKKYLNGDLQDLTQQEAKSYASLAADYDPTIYCSTAPLRDRWMQIETS